MNGQMGLSQISTDLITNKNSDAADNYEEEVKIDPQMNVGNGVPQGNENELNFYEATQNNHKISPGEF